MNALGQYIALDNFLPELELLEVKKESCGDCSQTEDQINQQKSDYESLYGVVDFELNSKSINEKKNLLIRKKKIS